jgi:nucleotide-binding universal stress UspA family protein
MYRRILVPLDGSPSAESILPFAETLARSFEAEILLVRVIEPVDAAAALATGDVDEAERLRGCQMAARQYLDACAERLAAAGHAVRARVALGAPAPEIVAITEAEKADVIAMTTHGRVGMRRLVYGSVAEAVVRAATVPVLILRMPVATAAPAEEERLS